MLKYKNWACPINHVSLLLSKYQCFFHMDAVMKKSKNYN